MQLRVQLQLRFLAGLTVPYIYEVILSLHLWFFDSLFDGLVVNHQLSSAAIQAYLLRLDVFGHYLILYMVSIWKY